MRTLLSDKELAARHGVSEKTSKRRRVRGDGPPFIRIGRFVRYDLRDVEEWENSRRYRHRADELAQAWGGILK